MSVVWRFLHEEPGFQREMGLQLLRDGQHEPSIPPKPGAPRPGGRAVAPAQAHPASKVAAEQELRQSSLTWVVRRFCFVYGDGDDHLEALPTCARAGKWHPAMRMSTTHHRDIATAMH